MLFWQGLIVLSLIAGLFIAWPLLKNPFASKSNDERIDREVAQADLYDDHLADLQASLDRGDIDEDQFKSLKAELQRNFVQETHVSEDSAKATGRSGKFVLVGVAALVPLLSTGLYTQWGAKPDWDIYQVMLSHRDNPAETKEEAIQQQRELIMLIRGRLNQKPDDAQLLYRLARMSMDVQDYDESVNAYRKIQKMQDDKGHSGQEVAEIAMGMAIAIFVREGNKVNEEVRFQTKKAISNFPFMYLANEMSGLIAFQDGRYRESIDHWRRAISQIDPKSRQGESLQRGMQRALAALRAQGEDYDFNSDTMGGVVKKAADESSADSSDGENAGPAIEVQVALKEGLSVSPSDAVFIYVRAWQGAKMPLAIQRKTVADLPISVKLDKSMAMAPGMDITTAEQLEVIARISKTGSAISASGDWQASQGPVTLTAANQPISLTISEQIP